MVERKLRAIVAEVKADESIRHALSTGEQIAVALVLDRRDWLEPFGTMLDAIDRLGTVWTAAALNVQREAR